MESDTEIQAIITAITKEIHAKHPELAERLGEMPVTIPTQNNQELNRKVLSDYYDSLKRILKK